jgi:undecaprenyl-diphosphatase
MNAEYGFQPILLGLLVSFVAGISAIKWMVSYLSRRDMAVFGWYRLIIAAIALILMQTGFVSS